jgi:NAD(P)-dependent dehydrogenase (short-subunit alcohol dehydrogenase family)
MKTKKAYILGGSGLIGSSVVKKFIKRGYKVLNIDIVDKKFTIKNKKKNYFYENLNLSNLNILEKEFKNLFKKYFIPDIFVNCSYPLKDDLSKNSFENLKIDSLVNNLNAHLASYMWTSTIILKEMKKKNVKGNVILLGSVYGLVGQDPDNYNNTSISENVSYSAIKGGIVSYSRLAASCFGKNGIRVNCICPGGILDKKKKYFRKNSKFFKSYLKKVPLKRFGNAQEIAEAIHFLSSSKATYISGSTFVIDGGLTAI